MIFISHSAIDKPVVEPIARKIAEVFGQENVFYDSWSIQPGDGIINEMNSGLEKCKFFFFFVSKNSLKSEMVKLEWQNAIVRVTRAEAKLIPVKLDDCLMPAILLQNLYINFYNYGPEVATRQMIEVIQGKNIFKKGEIQDFQNIRAYISQFHDRFTIEFRAEAYMEPQSTYVILISNGTQEDVECKVEGTSLPVRYSPNSSTFGGQNENAFIVSRPNATSPGFPFKVTFTKKTQNIIEVTGLLHAISSTQARNVPFTILK